MKKILMMLLPLFLLVGTAFAQDQQRDRDRIHDHLMLKEGKMIQIKNGEQVMLQTQLRLQNGTVVNPDGTYQLKERKMKQLREGECLNMDGKRYSDQERFENKMNQMKNKEMRMRGQNKNKEKGTKGGGKGKGNKN